MGTMRGIVTARYGARAKSEDAAVPIGTNDQSPIRDTSPRPFIPQ
jgi:hypothetical protein